MEDFFPAVGTVYFCRFIQALVNTRQRRKIDNGIPAEFLPDTHQHVQRLEIGGVAEHIGGFLACNGGEDTGDNAVGFAEIQHKAADNHRGNKMGHVGNCLCDFPESGSGQFIQQMAKIIGKGKLEKQ